MTEVEMRDAISQVNGLDGMTVNERLFASGLMNEFDQAKTNDQAKAKRILELLRVDKPSIDKIIGRFTERRNQNMKVLQGLFGTVLLLCALWMLYVFFALNFFTFSSGSDTSDADIYYPLFALLALLFLALLVFSIKVLLNGFNRRLNRRVK